MSGTLTEDQLEEIREAFYAFDVERTGSITVSELKGVLRSLGLSITEAELYEFATKLGCNRKAVNGECISFKDYYVVICNQLEQQNSITSLKQAFRIFDRNDVDYFTIPEVKTVLNHLGEKISDDDLKLMFKEIDQDNDGKITFTEFLSAMRS